jgi:hypothetical protein
MIPDKEFRSQATGEVHCAIGLTCHILLCPQKDHVYLLPLLTPPKGQLMFSGKTYKPGGGSGIQVIGEGVKRIGILST